MTTEVCISNGHYFPPRDVADSAGISVGLTVGEDDDKRVGIIVGISVGINEGRYDRFLNGCIVGDA